MKAWFSGDATAMAQAIVRGEFSAAVALQRTVQGLREQGADLNAVALWCSELGFEQARQLDAELSACTDDVARHALQQRRPFFGVPLLLKDVGPAHYERSDIRLSRPVAKAEMTEFLTKQA